MDEACPVNVWLGKLTALDMTPLGWLGRKKSTQTNKQHSKGGWTMHRRTKRINLNGDYVLEKVEGMVDGKYIMNGSYMLWCLSWILKGDHTSRNE